MRYSAPEKYEIIRLVEQSSLSVKQTLARLDTHRSTFYAWLKRYEVGGINALEDRKPVPRATWNKLPEEEQVAIVDQDREVVDVYLQANRDGAAAKRLFKRLLRSHVGKPRRIVMDKLRSYPAANREIMPDTFHSTEQYENNRAEQSHQATRVSERGTRRFK